MNAFKLSFHVIFLVACTVLSGFAAVENGHSFFSYTCFYMMFTTYFVTACLSDIAVMLRGVSK